jgi:hypothetical protein
MADYTVDEKGNTDAPWFSYRSQIKTLVIGKGVAVIGDYAFAGCSGLTSVSIPDGVAGIGEGVFAYCSGLTSVSIPNSITRIGKGAFYECSGLTSVSIGNSVTGIGDYAFCECSGLKSVSIPNNVTDIGEGAFCECSGLKSVSLGSSVTGIGRGAFADDSSLTSIASLRPAPQTIDGSVFYKVKQSTCTLYVPQEGLASFRAADEWKEFSNTLAVVGSGSCGENLTWECNVTTHTLTIGGAGAMYDYRGPLNVPWFRDYESQIKTVVIGSGVTSIGEYAFCACRKLTSVTIPGSVTSIGAGAFSNCEGLTSVSIPGSVTSIGEYAFASCGLTSATIPSGITDIGAGTFYFCLKLASVTIPSGVTSIGAKAFSCSGLTSVDIPSGVTSIGESAFPTSRLASINVDVANAYYASEDGVLFSKDKARLIQYPGDKQQGAYAVPSGVTGIDASAFAYCDSSLTSVAIPGSVTSIGAEAFYFCRGLTSINVDVANAYYASEAGVLFSKDKARLIQYPIGKQGGYAIPSSVTDIGERAFSGCTRLTSVAIPGSVTSIGDHAFADCRGLTSIAIPSSVTSIGDYAFNDCSGLTSITSLRSTPQAIGSDETFFGVDSTCTLYVPQASLAKYRAAEEWKKFENIEPLPE